MERGEKSEKKETGKVKEYDEGDSMVHNEQWVNFIQSKGERDGDGGNPMNWTSRIQKKGGMTRE